MKNAIFAIKPYRWNGMWVFDDERVGLDKEPFIAGADTMIDSDVTVKGIENAEDGFLMVFSADPFPDADFEVEWVREDSGGNVYKGRFEIDGEVQEMEGWLCPALNLYYPDALKRLYVLQVYDPVAKHEIAWGVDEKGQRQIQTIVIDGMKKGMTMSKGVGGSWELKRFTNDGKTITITSKWTMTEVDETHRVMVWSDVKEDGKAKPDTKMTLERQPERQRRARQ